MEFETMIYGLSIDDFSDSELFKLSYDKISAKRKQKVDTYHFNNDKYLSIGAELLLRYGVQRLGKEFDDLFYAEGENGKPYFENEPDIHFNISHSQEFVICVLSSKPIGCDIQHISDANIRVAKRFFTDSENTFIQSQKTEIKKQEMFIRLWTMKESFVKAIGTGLTLSLKAFTIEYKDMQYRILQDITSNSYYLKELPFDPSYCVAVCSSDKAIMDVKEIKMLDLKDLI